MSKQGLVCASLIFLLALSSCGKGGSHAVAAASFSGACAQSGDCAAIFEGELTCCGATSGCPNAAIRQDIVDAYTLEVSRRAPMCGAETKCISPATCGGTLTCPHGRCEFTPSGAERDGATAERSVAAADYAHACGSVDDCKAVYEGELGCCDLPCPNTAIRQDAFAQYEKDVGARAPLCIPTPGCVPLPGCTSGRLACTNGTCELMLPSPP
jgi:hypothetical protein